MNNTGRLHKVDDDDDRRSDVQAAELQAILDGAVDAILTITDRGIIRTVNPSTSSMFGYTQDELVGRNVSILMPEPYHGQHDTYLESYARTRQRHIIGIGREVVAKKKDGTVFPIDLAVSEASAGGETFFTGIIRDLSERHEIESQVRVQANAIESVDQGICIAAADVPDMPIVTCNAAMTTITGYEPSDIIGLSVVTLLSTHFATPDARDDVSGPSDLLQSINNRVHGQARWRCPRKDQSTFWSQASVAPVRSESGSVTHFVIVLSDVTEQTEREESLESEVQMRTKALQEAQAQLVQQARLAMLGKISGSIAHEIRNPLNAIKTSAYYLLHGQSIAAEKQREHLQRIDRQVSLINGVVTVLSDAARLPTPVRVPVPVIDLIHRSLQGVTLLPDINVQIDAPLGIADVLVDAEQIQITLRNLIRNARDAMQTGGTLTLQATTTGDDAVAILVRDTGTGIEQDVIDRIREPLFTTKPHGMGLGLSISYAIVENNNGTMGVTSELGKGTTFTMKLQARPQTAQQQPNESSHEPAE